MSRSAPIAALLMLAGLAACATAPQTAWVPRNDADLGADRATCAKEAEDVDIHSPGGYSGQYGAAAAMAGRMDTSDIRGGGADRVYDAIVDACMTRKGWTRAG